MTLHGVGIVDSAALHELSLTQASAQALSQPFGWMSLSPKAIMSVGDPMISKMN